jgi:hypothetical protein
MNAYMDFHGTPVKLPDPVKLKLMVIAYLREGGEHEEAELMARCSLEIGAVKFMVEHQYALDITLRCCRELVIRLRAPEDGAEESLLRSRIQQAVCDTLPGGYCIANFEARAGLNGGKPAVEGAVANGTGKNIPAAAITVGRWSYLPDFTRMWLDGEEYDLRERLKARLCLQFLVEQGAFAEASARHFEKEIDPYVREHSKRDPQRENADIKIHHYFNPSSGRLAKLGRELIHLAGHGTGCYYLNVL